MFFKSDNTTGASQEILDALQKANVGYTNPYGDDEYTRRLTKTVSELFETQVSVALVSTGTMANSLALSAMVPPYGAILCHSEAHIHNEEGGAPIFFTAGAKIVLLEGADGKVSPQSLQGTLNLLKQAAPRENKPSVLSLTQATERGTIYKLDELRELCTLAKEGGLSVHMDGARFSNALVSLNGSPAEMTWKAGVDVLCLGATKNGALAAEAIVFFNQGLAKDFEFRQKRAGQTFAKSRFFAVQMEAFFENDLWKRNALHANTMAKRLEKALISTGLVEISHPVEANEVFVAMPKSLVSYLIQEDVKFYAWGEHIYRFVTSFATDPDEIQNLIDKITLFSKHEPR